VVGKQYRESGQEKGTSSMYRCRIRDRGRCSYESRFVSKVEQTEILRTIGNCGKVAEFVSHTIADARTNAIEALQVTILRAANPNLRSK